jgi:hypothetical protein
VMSGVQLETSNNCAFGPSGPAFSALAVIG